MQMVFRAIWFTPVKAFRHSPKTAPKINSRSTSALPVHTYSQCKLEGKMAGKMDDPRQHGDRAIRYRPDQIDAQSSIESLPPILPLDLKKRIDDPVFSTSPHRPFRSSHQRRGLGRQDA